MTTVHTKQDVCEQLSSGTKKTRNKCHSCINTLKGVMCKLEKIHTQLSLF